MKRAIGAALLSFCTVTAASITTHDGNREAGAGVAQGLDAPLVHFGPAPLGDEDASSGAGRRHTVDIDMVGETQDVLCNIYYDGEHHPPVIPDAAFVANFHQG